VIDKILDSKDYQNPKFDLSADGKNHNYPARPPPQSRRFQWLMEERQRPDPSENEQGGDFMIRPDSKSW